MYVLFYMLDEVLYCLQSISFIHITMNDLYNHYLSFTMIVKIDIIFMLCEFFIERFR